MSVAPATDQHENAARLLDWYRQAVEVIASLPPDQRAEFDAWDRQRVLDCTGEASTDWPGLAALLPPFPSAGTAL